MQSYKQNDIQHVYTWKKHITLLLHIQIDGTIYFCLIFVGKKFHYKKIQLPKKYPKQWKKTWKDAKKTLKIIPFYAHFSSWQKKKKGERRRRNNIRPSSSSRKTLPSAKLHTFKYVRKNICSFYSLCNLLRLLCRILMNFFFFLKNNIFSRNWLT